MADWRDTAIPVATDWRKRAIPIDIAPKKAPAAAPPVSHNTAQDVLAQGTQQDFFDLRNRHDGGIAPHTPTALERSLALTPEQARHANEMAAKAIPNNQEIPASGYLDRQLVKGKQAMMGIGSGLARAVDPVLRGETSPATDVLVPGLSMLGKTGLGVPLADRLAERADAVDRYVNTPVQGDTSWQDVKDANGVLGTTAATAKFIAEQGPSSMLYLPLYADPVGIAAYGTSLAGQIGQQRAVADGRKRANTTDLAIAAPAAAASVALDLYGIDKVLHPVGKSVLTRIGKAMLAEGGTEALQNPIEYAGGSIGTKEGFDPQQALDQGLAGGLVGAAMGGALHGAIEVHGGHHPATTDAEGRLVNRDPADTRTVPPGHLETAIAAAANPTPEDIASPLDTHDIVAGNITIAQANATQHSNGLLQASAMPEIGKRVAIDHGDGKVETGTMRDTFSDETGDGVVIERDGLPPLREYNNNLADAGVAISELPDYQTPALDALQTGHAQSPGSPAAQGPAGAAHPAGHTNLNATIVNYFREKGYSEGQAQGIAAGIQAESRSDPNVINSIGAMGIGQWLGPRKKALIAQYGLHPTLEQQLDFMHSELQGGDPGGKHVLAQHDAASVLDAYVKKFMRPAAGAETEGDIKRGTAALGGAVPGPTSAATVAGTEAAAPPDFHASPMLAGIPMPSPEGAAAPSSDTGTVKTAGSDLRGEAAKPGWVNFAPDSGSLNIPRADMPQIKAENRSAMVQFMRARGIDSEEIAVPASSLRPSQAEFSPEKVQGAKEYTGGDRAILVSQDGYVVDGHHQWLAARDQGADVRAIQLNAPIADVLAAAHEMPSTSTADATPGPTLDEHPGLVIHNLRTGEEHVIQPAGTVAPAKAETAGSVSPALADKPVRESKARLEPTPSGKGIALFDASPEELAAIERDVPKAKASVRSDGARTYSLKYADELRAAIAGVTNPVTHAEGPTRKVGGRGRINPNPSLIEWIANRGGIWDGHGRDARDQFKGGDFAAVGLGDWHNKAPFRRKAIRDAALGHGDRGADNVLRDAIEAGYFPELEGADQSRYDQLHDVQHLYDAINEELSGKPRYSTDGAPQAAKPAARVPDDGELEHYASDIERVAMEQFGAEPEDLAPEFLKFAAQIKFDAPEGMSDADAFMEAVNDYANRARMELFDDTGETAYDDIANDWPFDNSEPGQEAGAHEEGRAGHAGERDGPPPRGTVGAPVAAGKGQASEGVAPKLDAGPAADPAIAERQRQEAKLRAEAPLRGSNKTGQAQDGTIGTGLFDAADAPQMDLTAQAPSSTAKFAGNKLFTEDKVAAAKARMAARMNRLNSGVDPEMLIDGMIIAGGHIEAGMRNFAEFAKAMRDDFGNAITPYLQSFWEGARSYPGLDNKDMTTPDVTAAMHGMMLAEPDTSILPPTKNTERTVAPSHDPALQALADHFANGGSFATIVEARRFLTDLNGEAIRPGTAEAKAADEKIEAAVAQAARKIVAQGMAPRETYRALVGLYARQPNLSVRSSTSIEQQAYSTPVPLAYLASQRAGITQDTTVYEPSAGNGALLIDARATYVTANEINPDRAAHLKAMYRGATITEQDASDFSPKGQFDAVIANPPFGPVKDAEGDTRIFDLGNRYETREIDHAIAMQALASMKDNGRAVLIVGSINKLSTSPEVRADAYNAKAKREFYYRLYGEYNVTDHFTVDGDLYNKQGAGWPVDVIVIEGRGKSALKLPAVTAPRQYSSWGALEAELERGPGILPETGTAHGGLDLQGGRSNASDGRDRPGSGGRRTDREQQQPAAGEPSSLRDGPVAGQSGSGRLDERAAEPDAGLHAEPVADHGNRAAGRPSAVKSAALAGEGQRQVAYVPASSSASLDTLVPVNMQTAITAALNALQDRVGKVDDFVAGRLGYKPGEIPGYFSAEQVDALALAIDNMERGAGFIIGDQTGIGKGRVVAGIIRYAIKSGRMPIFVTEKPNLYADMYRDMVDIGLPDMLGKPIDILMTNASEKVPLDDSGQTVLKTPGTAEQNAKLMRVADGDHGGTDVVFTTYAQMQSIAGATTPRQSALSALAPGSILILDESHNAGGQGAQGEERKSKKQIEAEKNGTAAMAGMSRAQFVRSIAAKAHGVFFSSATYAKRPDVMDLYSSTDMKLAVADIKNLSTAISKGGIPMQQVVATMLTEAGQYVRRERSFDGVAYNTPSIPVDRKAYAQFANVLSAIQKFQEGYITQAIKSIDKDIRAEAQAISHDGSVGSAGATSTNFTSVMHNLVEQMLVALKAEPAVERAIEAIKAGKKPVITLANTMGSFIDEYAEENDIGNGGEMPADFRALLVRYANRTRHYSVRKPFSNEKAEKHYVSDDMLSEDGLAAYNAVIRQIEAMDLHSVPISPIDHMRNRLQQAGYKVGEITGRTATIDYSGPVPRFRIRPGSEKSIAGKRAAITGFNSGTIDAMILNQSGSTGLSLHASSKFKDQRPRKMILAQAERNIDTHMQMLGRIHRTGQVVLPEYDQLVAEVPAEMRPAAVLAKKMASLNASTTGARDSAMAGEDVPDFMNEYGDEIAARMMEEDPALFRRLLKPLKESTSKSDQAGLEREDAARRVTGKLTLLPLEEQEAFYDEFLSEYRDYLAQKEAAGEASLEAKTLELDAKLLTNNQVVGSTDASSPFGAAVNREVLDVKRIGKPMQPAAILREIDDSIGMGVQSGDPDAALQTMQERGRNNATGLQERGLTAFQAYRMEALDGLEPDKVAAVHERLDRNLRSFKSLTDQLFPGASISLTSGDGDVMQGVVMKLERKGDTKNPLALGSYRATIALADASSRVTMPLSQLRTMQMDADPTIREIAPIRQIDFKPIMQAFAEMQSESREKRTMFTGNILAAYEHTSGKGQIVNYVSNDGTVKPGIMMRRGYDYKKEMGKNPVPFRTADQVLAWVQRGEIAFADNLKIENNSGRLVVTAAAAKAVGGRYFLDPAVRAALGSDFYKKSTGMAAETAMSNAGPVIAALQRAGATFSAKTNLDAAREIVAAGEPKGVAAAREREYDPSHGQADDNRISPAAPMRGEQGSVPASPRRDPLRALGIAEEIKTAGVGALVGRQVGSPAELAELAQVYRDPRYETFRVFFTKGNEIVHATGVSARLAGSAPLMPNDQWRDFGPWLNTAMESSGADGFWMLHNHPTGRPEPSKADIALTKSVAEARAGSFKGHVVINSGEYASIDARGLVKIRKLNLPGEDALLKPSRPHAVLGRMIYSGDALASVAKEIQKPGYVTLVSVDTGLKVRAIADFPTSDLGRSKIILLGALRRLMRQSGGDRVFLIGEPEHLNSDAVRSAHATRLIEATIDTQGNYLADPWRRDKKPSPFTEAAGRFVAEDRKEFRPGREEVGHLVSLGGQDPTWKGRVAEGFDIWRTRMQDRYLPLLRVQQEVEKATGKELPPRLNPYLGEELMTGRIGSRLEDLADDHVGPLFDAMHAEKVTTDELETYLYARHAPERNARMSEINPEFDEGSGSGMTDIAAKAIMNRIRDAGQMDAMERLAARVDAIRDMSIKQRVESGLMSKEQADEWKSTYENYVPLRGFKEIDDGDPALADRINRSGGGINVRGKESKPAYGRRSVADSPIAYTIMQAEEAIVRGETNRVAQRFVNLAKAAPDEEFWQVNKVTQGRKINEDSGLVERYLNHNITAADKDWTVSAKFNGKEVRVTMNRQNMAARRLADAMKNLTQHELDFITQHLGKLNRFLSAVNTSWNPEFVITNAFRDLQEATLNLNGVGVDDIAGRVLKSYPAALKASMQGAFGREGGEWGKWYDEFLSAGGRVYFNHIENIEGIKKRIENAAQTSAAKVGEGPARLRAKQILIGVRDVIENVNMGVENAVRLATFRAAREAGLSPDKAASMAKNVTVNFNRRGTFGPAMNAAYLFYNASMQGSVRMLQALRSPRVRKMVAGIMATGFLIEFLNALVAGTDDDGESYYDKVSDFDKSRNMIIALGGSKFLRIPLPYGYGAFWNAGRTAGEIARRGGDRALESTANLASSILDAFNPVGGSGSILNMLAPTILDPVVDLTLNRDFTGRPIMPDQKPYEAPIPDHERSWSSVPAHWKAVTDFLSDATGGDDVQAGAIDISPQTLEYLAGTAFGAAGAFMDRAASMKAPAMSDEGLSINDVPFARKLVGSKPSWYDKSAYYDRLGQIDQAVADTKAYAEGGDIDKAQSYAERNQALLSLESTMKAARSEMGDVRRARSENELAKRRGDIAAEDYKVRRSEISAAEKQIIQSFNTQWNQTVNHAGGDSAGE